MIAIRQTRDFARWFDGLTDRRAKARVQVRIDRLGLGLFGDCAPVGGGVSELRIHYGPGYRVYFKTFGSSVLILLAGGDKDTQQSDIRKALQLASEL